MDKIEKIARAICKSQCHEPDELVLPIKQPYFGAKGHVVVSSNYPLIPSWHLYVLDARAALEAMSANQE